MSVTKALPLFRLLLMKDRKYSATKRSIMICILQTLVSDPTSNARHFSEILKYATTTQTLGLKLSEFYKLFISKSCTKQLLEENLETLKLGRMANQKPDEINQYERFIRYVSKLVKHL